MIRRSYASDHAELREGVAALARSGLTSVQGTLLVEGAEKLLRQHDLIDTLVDTLVWVRKNYGGGSTTEINARIDAAIDAADRADVVTLLKEQLARFEGQSERRHWRHVTSGMFVTEIGRGRMQTAEPIGDMTPIVIYHHAGENGGGTVWARPTREFEDGRFVAFIAEP